MTWSATEVGSRAQPGFNAQVRYSGRLNGDPAGEIGAGAAIFTSPTYYDLFRWGDYSAVSIDPLNSSIGWFVNENIDTTTTWGTRIGAVGF